MPEFVDAPTIPLTMSVIGHLDLLDDERPRLEAHVRTVIEAYRRYVPRYHNHVSHLMDRRR